MTTPMICLMLVSMVLPGSMHLSSMIWGFGLNRISPITFDENVFQTPNNRTQGRALTSTPRKQGKNSGLWEDQQKQHVQTRTLVCGKINKNNMCRPVLNLTLLIPSARNTGRFLLPGQSNPTGYSWQDSEDTGNQTVFPR